MAIVPLANEVSMLTIRNVINQRAVLIGQARSRGTSYGLYGRDQSTGYVQANIKNISSSTINITVELKQNGNVGARTETFNLNANSNRLVTFSSLSGKAGSFSKGRKRDYNPATSYTGNEDYDLTVKENAPPYRSVNINNIDIASKNRVQYWPIVFGEDFPREKISIARDSGDITANYQLKDGVQIPKNLADTATPVNAKLSDWRGAQVIQGTVVTRSSIKGRYGADKGLGVVHFYLASNGFSDGPVTVTLPGNKALTKNVANTNYSLYAFDELRGGKTYTFYIKDQITGAEIKKNFYIKLRGHNTSFVHESYSFNGDDQFLAFTF